ncbi:MAG: hypothetical protein ABJF09_07740 [Qipengyuania citrea]|jgi:hypothetical protein|uniref:hypothetical protein n=1 Tax=Alphaproteobacteria TaxID=28211 RepID=UPI0007B9CA93|nr:MULTISPECIES: hypothetical protein [unclassified Erythrobacter]KZZ05216.1 hypothetical protein A3748_16875 [Erythrobacter sp. HI0077]|tara:strand:- start:1058 stop:1318 length:261 start_codon:yes stop_codon:yes gene_type:complete
MTRFNRRFGRIFIPIWIGLALLFTIAAAADSVWQFGWGYSSEDALLGLGMVGFGFLFWLAWHWMLKLIDWLNVIFLGSDAGEGTRD